MRLSACTHTSFRNGLAGNAPKDTDVSRRASALIHCDGDGRMLKHELRRADRLGKTCIAQQLPNIAEEVSSQVVSVCTSPCSRDAGLSCTAERLGATRQKVESSMLTDILKGQHDGQFGMFRRTVTFANCHLPLLQLLSLEASILAPLMPSSQSTC
jgi:hypothetical protein